MQEEHSTVVESCDLVKTLCQEGSKFGDNVVRQVKFKEYKSGVLGQVLEYPTIFYIHCVSVWVIL